MPDLEAVRAFLRGRCGPEVELERLELCSLERRSDGSAISLYEVPAGNHEPVRLLARRPADRGDSHATEPGLSFALFPEDPGLPALGHALDPRVMAPILEATLHERREGREIQRVVARVVRYKPERRCLLRYEVSWSGSAAPRFASVYGKVSARPVFERTRYTLRRLREAACGVDFVLPEPLGDVSELAIELFSHVPGETLSDLCERQDSARSCRRVAGALRQLHELHVDLGGAERPADRCRELAQARDELRVGLGGPSARVDELASALEAEAGANRVDTPGLIHGDFHGDNVLVDGETIALLDTEKCARGDPADDVGSLWAQLTLLWLKSGRRNPRLLAARSAFVERYLDVGGRALAPRVRTHAALHGFLYASRCLQRPQRRDRHAHARGLLDASTSLLEGGPL